MEISAPMHEEMNNVFNWNHRIAKASSRMYPMNSNGPQSQRDAERCTENKMARNALCLWAEEVMNAGSERNKDCNIMKREAIKLTNRKKTAIATK
jgi:hypothetical protein